MITIENIPNTSSDVGKCCAETTFPIHLKLFNYNYHLEKRVRQSLFVGTLIFNDMK